jgi:hypothetical protein
MSPTLIYLLLPNLLPKEPSGIFSRAQSYFRAPGLLATAADVLCFNSVHTTIIVCNCREREL